MSVGNTSRVQHGRGGRRCGRIEVLEKRKKEDRKRTPILHSRMREHSPHEVSSCRRRPARRAVAAVRAIGPGDCECPPETRLRGDQQRTV